MKIKPVCNASAQEAIWGTEWNGDNINLLAPELFFFYFSTHCIKMWIKQEPNMLELWNKLHFEEKKTESIYHV